MQELFKTLGDTNRLRIINLLTYAELCVCEIETLLELSQTNVSRHLSKLKNVGIISSSKDGQWIHYKIHTKFIEGNELLVKYLDEQFKSNEMFLKDCKRYKKYKELGLNCRYITQDKKGVLNLLIE